MISLSIMLMCLVHTQQVFSLEQNNSFFEEQNRNVALSLSAQNTTSNGSNIVDNTLAECYNMAQYPLECKD